MLRRGKGDSHQLPSFWGSLKLVYELGNWSPSRVVCPRPELRPLSCLAGQREPLWDSGQSR